MFQVFNIHWLLFSQSCSTLCSPMDCSMPSFPVLHHLPEFAQTKSTELVMPSNRLVLCCPFSSCLQYFPASGSFPVSQCDPIDGSPPGSPVSGILQARTLEWAAISFSNAWKWKMKGKSLSRIRLLVTPWTAAYQAPSFIGFSRQEYWSGVPLPSSRLLTRKNKT